METPALIVKAIVSAMESNRLEVADALMRVLSQHFPDEYKTVGHTVKTAHYLRVDND